MSDAGDADTEYYIVFVFTDEGIPHCWFLSHFSQHYISSITVLKADLIIYILYKYIYNIYV